MWGVHYNTDRKQRTNGRSASAFLTVAAVVVALRGYLDDDCCVYIDVVVYWTHCTETDTFTVRHVQHHGIIDSHLSTSLCRWTIVARLSLSVISTYTVYCAQTTVWIVESQGGWICRTGKWRTKKFQGVENAGLENDGQKCRAGKCMTGKWWTTLQEVENAGLEIDGQKCSRREMWD